MCPVCPRFSGCGMACARTIGVVGAGGICSDHTAAASGAWLCSGAAAGAAGSHLATADPRLVAAAGRANPDLTGDRRPVAHRHRGVDQSRRRPPAGPDCGPGIPRSSKSRRSRTPARVLRTGGRHQRRLWAERTNTATRRGRDSNDGRAEFARIAGACRTIVAAVESLRVEIEAALRVRVIGRASCPSVEGREDHGGGQEDSRAGSAARAQPSSSPYPSRPLTPRTRSIDRTSFSMANGLRM